MLWVGQEAPTTAVCCGGAKAALLVTEPRSNLGGGDITAEQSRSYAKSMRSRLLWSCLNSSFAGHVHTVHNTLASQHWPRSKQTLDLALALEG